MTKDQVATDSLKDDYQVYYAQDDSSYLQKIKRKRFTNYKPTIENYLLIL